MSRVLSVGSSHINCRAGELGCQGALAEQGQTGGGPRAAFHAGLGGVAFYRGDKMPAGVWRLRRVSGDGWARCRQCVPGSGRGWICRDSGTRAVPAASALSQVSKRSPALDGATIPGHGRRSGNPTDPVHGGPRLSCDNLKSAWQAPLLGSFDGVDWPQRQTQGCRRQRPARASGHREHGHGCKVGHSIRSLVLQNGVVDRLPGQRETGQLFRPTFVGA